MIFPIGDENVKGGSRPYLSYSFIVLNILIFIFQITMETGDLQRFVYQYGTIPAEIVMGQNYTSLVTSMFLHGGWMHIIGNMLFLWVFADNIEAVIGNSRFLVFYILGGLFATGAHILSNTASVVPSIGASGAISAVLGAYLVMFPKSQIKVLFFFKIIYITAMLFLGFWIIQQLLAGIASMGPQTAETSGVAWWAHIGGFIFGVLSGMVFRKLGFMEGVYHNKATQDNFL